jgi:uncharacterized protein (TIGR00255 family)
MLLSMTGYGRAVGTHNDKVISVEVRALNAKVTDVKLRFLGDYKEKELELRRVILEHAERGKLDVLIEVQSADGAAAVSLNEALFRGYCREVKRLAEELQLPMSDILPALLRIPNIINSSSAEIDDEEFEAILSVVRRALDNLREYRRQEGKALGTDLRMRVEHILSLLGELLPYEQERFVRMRERLRANLEENFGKENLDANRFEQEILYYLEKMDLTEEKVRLEQHCRYFIEQLEDANRSAGRSLGFISQEMGREINTLGAKAYDANIQRIVVQMKDELEKIKEQLANVL